MMGEIKGDSLLCDLIDMLEFFDQFKVVDVYGQRGIRCFLDGGLDFVLFCFFEGSVFRLNFFFGEIVVVQSKVDRLLIMLVMYKVDWLCVMFVQFVFKSFLYK